MKFLNAANTTNRIVFTMLLERQQKSQETDVSKPGQIKVKLSALLDTSRGKSKTMYFSNLSELNL